jgi:hypothetical protein
MAQRKWSTPTVKSAAARSRLATSVIRGSVVPFDQQWTTFVRRA